MDDGEIDELLHLEEEMTRGDVGPGPPGPSVAGICMVPGLEDGEDERPPPKQPRQQLLSEMRIPERIGPRPVSRHIMGRADNGDDSDDDAASEASEHVDVDHVAATSDEQRAIATLNRLKIAGKCIRAEQGTQPWIRGRNCADSVVHFARLEESKLREFGDNTRVKTTAGVDLPYDFLKHGVTLLEFGKSAGKTWRVIQRFKKMPIRRGVFLTPRRNLAQKLAADLENSDIAARNYLEIEGEISMIEWIDFDVIIISVEQLHKLKDTEGAYERFRGGLLFCDEGVTMTASLGGETVRWPMETLTSLSELGRRCLYIVVADADISIDGRVEALIRGCWFTRDVLHLQSTVPASKRTLCVGFNSNTEDSKNFQLWLELSLHRSREAGESGSPNRTFYGGATPKQCIKVGKLACKVGVTNLPYHGKMCEATRKLHFRDADTHMSPYNATILSTVGAIGTDWKFKTSHAFFETNKGSSMMGVAPVRMTNQLMGRPARDEDKPLDGLTLADGTRLENVMFVLVGSNGQSESERVECTMDGNGTAAVDRVTRKFHAARDDTRVRIEAARAADNANYREFAERNAVVISDGMVETMRLHTTSAPSAPIGICDCLEEIMAWNDVERRDNYESHVVKNIELWRLPTSNYDLVPMPQFGEAERVELEAFRAKIGQITPIAIDEDRRVSELKGKDMYKWVKAEVARRGEEEKFWFDCYGLRPRSTEKGVTPRQPTGDGRDIAMKHVWGVLQHLKQFPEDKIYLDMAKDEGKFNILARAIMRFQPEESYRDADVRAQQHGVQGDVVTARTLKAGTKIDGLRKFANAVSLGVCDLLEPRLFSVENDGSPSNVHSVWVAAHNRIQQGAATQSDQAMATNARVAARELGCTRISINGTTPTSILVAVRSVLEQQCAMSPARDAKRGLVVRKLGARNEREREVLIRLPVTELAPGAAEWMLLWHDRLRRHVPAAEYRQRHDESVRAEREYALQRRLAREGAAFDDMVGAHTDTAAQPTDGQPLPSTQQPTRVPYDMNVMYESYEAVVIDQCLSDWSGDEKRRRAATNAINIELASAELSDVETSRLRTWATALRRLEVRHWFVAQLNGCLGGRPWIAEGQTDRVPGERRVQQVKYTRMAGGEQVGRRHVKGGWYTDNVGESRCIAIAGMPMDLYATLTGSFYTRIEGVNSVLHCYLNLARRACLSEKDTACLQSILASTTMATDQTSWFFNVATFYVKYLQPVPSDVAAATTQLVARIESWPEKLANGTRFESLLQSANLPAVMETQYIAPFLKEHRLLKTRLLHADANREYVERHTARIQRENKRGVTLDKTEVEDLVVELLLSGEEDKVLEKVVDVIRRETRAVMGKDAFRAQPVEARDGGAILKGGLMLAINASVATDVDDKGRMQVLNKIESELEHIGLEYKLELVPNLGVRGAIDSVVEARRALAEATVAHESVRAAVADA